ncbi:MAG: S8 family serine peptidase, partial [Thermoleophilia bacterium]|nr:S8 family serine peptidase [Thermoleophilia bacterium]
FDGQSVYVRFRLTSDASVQMDGAHIDDVAVKCLGATFSTTDYEKLSGTSMAAPHVTGVAALVLAQKPSLGPVALRDVVLRNGDRIAGLSGVVATGRRLNAARAVAAVTPDTTPPNTTITSGPPSRTTRRRATFRLASSEPRSSFQCKLDARAWRACASPKTYRNLKKGSHTFRARARDAAGNLDPTPAKRSWRIR